MKDTIRDYIKRRARLYFGAAILGWLLMVLPMVATTTALLPRPACNLFVCAGGLPVPVFVRSRVIYAAWSSAGHVKNIPQGPNIPHLMLDARA